MHRFILDTSDGLHTDHINRNKLDNRRENLRAVSAALNAQNGDTGATKTVYKDLPRYITYDQSRGKFVATFVRRKRFDTLEEAKEYVRGGQ
jgi:hypothetical protein